jgi:hypothetical protein
VQPAAPTIVPAPRPGQAVATDSPAAVTGGSVDVVVTYAGWDPTAQAMEVDGFVSGVVEAGGTCRATLTSGGRTVASEVRAQPDATTTTCGVMQVHDAALTAGTWQVVLSYRSAGSSGASAPTTVAVPSR